MEKYLEAVENLFQEVSGLVLGQTFLLLEVVLKVTPVAKLSDYKKVAVVPEIVDEADHILVPARLEHLDFGLD